MKRKFSRRDFLKMAGYLFLSSFVVGTGGLAYGIFIEPEELDVKEVEIKLPRLPHQFSGYRIVQFSDLHMGGWMNGKRLRKVVDVVKKQQPDLVVITGDFFTGPVWDENINPCSRGICCGTFPVDSRFYRHWVFWAIMIIGLMQAKARKALQRCGVIEIGNGLYSLERDGQELHIAGVDDIWYEHDDLDKVLSMLPETGEVILLAHEPDFADKSAKTGRFGLQLSGHSHGGQIVLPFIGAPVLPRLGTKISRWFV